MKILLSLAALALISSTAFAGDISRFQYETDLQDLSVYQRFYPATAEAHAEVHRLRVEIAQYRAEHHIK